MGLGYHWAMKPLAQTPCLAPSVRVVTSTGSTNSDLLAMPWPESATLALDSLWALEQTAGRGRRGKSWLAQGERSICLSIRRDVPDPEHQASRQLPGLSLALGVALSSALEQWLLARGVRQSFALKWPNDIVQISSPDGSMQKLGGILIEARQQAPWLRLVAGFGLNLFAPSEQIVGGLHPAGLFSPDQNVTLDAAERYALVTQLALAMHTCLERCLLNGWTVYQAQYEARDALQDQPVQWQAATLSSGVARGVDASGALRVTVDNSGLGQEILINAGEVSVRRRTRCE
jgi:BirA family transcriptional regulator, biotin operon repressor / biotin---[acetyl-CoA-carboxylase] ligase